MNILLLEDEYTLRKSIKELLEECDYRVDDFGNGDDAYDAIQSKEYDLWIFDVHVGGMDGFTLLERLRKKNINTPTIFITSLTQIDNIEKGFLEGCCDYIKKPFDLAELRLRVNNALKKSFDAKSDIITIGRGYIYDLKNFCFKKNNQEIQLSKTEKMMIELFIKHRNQIVTSEMINYYIWADGMVDPANIRVQINNLRKKLDKGLIVNIRGLGYKLEFTD